MAAVESGNPPAWIATAMFFACACSQLELGCVLGHSAAVLAVLIAAWIII
jgi:hypothetical protein